MKLQKQRSYEYEGKEHYKYVITIPKKMVETMRWGEGDELRAQVRENYLVLKKVGEKEIEKGEKTSYEEFKKKVEEVLRAESGGLTWAEIKKRTNLRQKVPNNMWVKMMENDIGLVREKRERRTIWRLKG
jgi:bifunctional DNA-binding transcriptional regulator/antitoxin component of YhaV-PrlF toxin-antitoxin module